HRRPAVAVPLVRGVDRDVVDVQDMTSAQLAFGKPQPPDRVAIRLDPEDEVARGLQALRQHGGEVGLRLLHRSRVGLATVDLDALGVAGLRGGGDGALFGAGEGSQADGRLGWHAEDYRRW